MTDIPMKMYWMGEDIEAMDKPALIEIIRRLGDDLNATRQAAIRSAQILVPAHRPD